MPGKCPTCDVAIMQVFVSAIRLNEVGAGAAWDGVSYTCPNCTAILGVGVDPAKLRDSIVDEIKTELRRKLSK